MSTRRETVEAALQGQAMLLVKMMGELFEEADAAVEPEQFKSVAKKAWMQNANARAWIAAKRVVDAAFAPLALGKGGDTDGKPRGLDELEEQIRQGTERIQQLLAKPGGTAPAGGGGTAHGGMVGVASGRLAGGAAAAAG